MATVVTSDGGWPHNNTTLVHDPLLIVPDLPAPFLALFLPYPFFLLLFELTGKFTMPFCSSLLLYPWFHYSLSST